MARPATYDHLRSQKKPIKKTVQVVLDPELAEQHQELREKIDTLRIRAGHRTEDVQLQLELGEAERELEELVDLMIEQDAVVEMTFRGIGRQAYDRLVELHPPTSEQVAKAKKQGMGDSLAWNLDTFPPAVVSASLIEPKLSQDQVRDLWYSEDWNQMELAVLFQTALEVNGTRRTVELGKGSRTTKSSAPKSDTASSTESPTPSS